MTWLVIFHTFLTFDEKRREMALFGKLACQTTSARSVRRQMVVDKFDKKLRNTFYSLRSFMYHFSHNSQSTILCPS